MGADHDPLAIAEHAKQEYGMTLTPLDELTPGDAVVLAVPHDSYLAPVAFNIPPALGWAQRRHGRVGEASSYAKVGWP